ncbi:hypothetical protein [Flavobacterium sp.]|uniref:hypothetical protein n=1 Tax=Flavobacterium sp. TaxID=239 RepID=UPI0039E317E7
MKTKAIAFFLLLGSFSFAQQSPDMASMMANKVDAAQVPDAYPFTWKYKMDLNTDGKSFQADYLLEPNAKYFGMNMSQSGNDVTMVMDTNKKLTVMGFGKGAQKMGMATKMRDYLSTGNKEGAQKFAYKSLPDKTILGYKCKGVEASNTEMTMVFYFTNEAPVNFVDWFKAPGAQKIPDAFGAYFKPGDKPLVLSMEFTDKANGKKTSMQCVALEKNAFTFKKSDYKFM